MNREETLALYEQGVEAWNKWANEMLEERKRLEEAGNWQVNELKNGFKIPINDKTKTWFRNSEANLSSNKADKNFSQALDFSYFIFPGETKIENANFKNSMLFEHAVFNNNLILKNVKFLDFVTFYNSKFNCHSNFSSTIFNHKVIFSEAIFMEDTSFHRCIFEDHAGFQNIVFLGLSTFSESTFHFSSQFNGSKFQKFANFYGCIFESATRFDNIEFNEAVSFNTSRINHLIGFTSSTFNGHTSFQNIVANLDLIFENTKFLKTLKFNGSVIKGLIDFKNAEFNYSSDFSATQFIKGANYSSIRSKGTFTLESAKFKNELPDFIQANFEEAPRLDNIELGDAIPPKSLVKSITTFIHPDIKARYQALKRLAVQAHDHENEQRFWAGELRSDRSLRTEDGSWNLRPLVSAFWWGNIAYGCVSDYGRSIVRPIGALLILICLMTTLHLTASKTPLTYDKVFSAGYIAANKSFLYLGTDPTKRSIIKEKYTALYGANENQTPKIPKTILTAEFIQTLLSAIFIFLALLGIRNNFKMK
ncbi:MAG: pentapeptide repeat-containing protein [Rhodomicrobiaceae bacterium]